MGRLSALESLLVRKFSLYNQVKSSSILGDGNTRTGVLFVNIDSLAIFCLVVEEGSISQAAKIHYVSQPAATRQIHLLEDAYGVLLFDRTDGKLQISTFGEALYPFAKEIVRDYQQSREKLRQLAGESQEHLQIGASFTIAEYLLPAVLGGFKQNDPDIQVSLQVGNTPKMLEALANDDIELALVEGAVENEDLHIRKFMDDELILVCSSNHRWKERNEIHIGELAQERMIWREESSGTRALAERVLDANQVLDQIENYMELGSTQAIKGAVEANLGVSIVSEMAVTREIKQGTLCKVPITEVDLKRGLWLVQKPRRFHQIGIDKFTRYIDESYMSQPHI